MPGPQGSTARPALWAARGAQAQVTATSATARTSPEAPESLSRTATPFQIQQALEPPTLQTLSGMEAFQLTFSSDSPSRSPWAPGAVAEVRMFLRVSFRVLHTCRPCTVRQPGVPGADSSYGRAAPESALLLRTPHFTPQPQGHHPQEQVCKWNALLRSMLTGKKQGHNEHLKYVLRYGDCST